MHVGYCYGPVPTQHRHSSRRGAATSSSSNIWKERASCFPEHHLRCPTAYRLIMEESIAVVGEGLGLEQCKRERVHSCIHNDALKLMGICSPWGFRVQDTHGSARATDPFPHATIEAVWMPHLSMPLVRLASYISPAGTSSFGATSIHILTRMHEDGGFYDSEVLFIELGRHVRYHKPDAVPGV